MRKIVILSMIAAFAFAGMCSDLMQKYNTPDPSVKTMKQLKRWVKRKMKNSPDKDKVLQCLLDRAADNPNKASVAGE